MNDTGLAGDGSRATHWVSYSSRSLHLGVGCRLPWHLQLLL